MPEDVTNSKSCPLSQHTTSPGLSGELGLLEK